MFALPFLGKIIWGFITGNATGILQTALNFFAHKEDVDLGKVQATAQPIATVASGILQANAQVAATKATVAVKMLDNPLVKWAVGGVVLLVCLRFGLIVFDSTYWWIGGCVIDGIRTYGDSCSWNIPPIKGIYGGAETEFLLFWVVAKPVDSAVQGVTAVLTSALRKNA